MKEMSLLVWLSQLGLSVAIPPALLIWLAVFLRDHFCWGQWVIWVGIVLGIYCAVVRFVSALRSVSHLTNDKKQKNNTVSFNEHD